MVSFKGFWTKKGPEIMHFCLTNLGIFLGYFPMNSVQACKRGRGAQPPPPHKFLKKKEREKKRKKKRKEERKEERGKGRKNSRKGKRREKRRKKRREKT